MFYPDVWQPHLDHVLRLFGAHLPLNHTSHSNMVGLHSSNGAFHVPGDLGFRAVSNMGSSLRGQPARVEFSSDNSLIGKRKQHSKNKTEQF